MALFEELERVKLQFISVCESLVHKERISEADFDQILQLLDNMDELDENHLHDELSRLTKGSFDLLFWEKPIFPGK